MRWPSGFEWGGGLEHFHSIMTNILLRWVCHSVARVCRLVFPGCLTSKLPELPLFVIQQIPSWLIVSKHSEHNQAADTMPLGPTPFPEFRVIKRFQSKSVPALAI